MKIFYHFLTNQTLKYNDTLLSYRETKITNLKVSLFIQKPKQNKPSGNDLAVSLQLTFTLIPFLSNQTLNKGLLPLSWSVSDATPPQTIAPRRPLPMGRASVQCLAGPKNLTLSGSEEPPSSSPPPHPGLQHSISVGGLTRTHSPSSILETTKENKKRKKKKKKPSKKLDWRSLAIYLLERASCSFVSLDQ